MKQAVRRNLHRILGRTQPEAVPDPLVWVEDHVTLDGCTIIGETRVGYRSYANDTLLRNVTIGRYCSIGRRCSIGGARHDMAALTTHPFAASKGFESDPPTIIGNDVWIGDNVIVVAGLSIGDGAVIGAGAVVTRDVAPYTIVIGVPAKPLRTRFKPAVADALSACQWWRYGDAAIELVRDDDLAELPRRLKAAKLQPVKPHHRPYQRSAG